MAMFANRRKCLLVWFSWLIPLSVALMYFVSVMTIKYSPPTPMPLTVKVDELEIDTLYKSLVRNADGSIDVILNIPHGEEFLNALNFRLPVRRSVEDLNIVKLSPKHISRLVEGKSGVSQTRNGTRVRRETRTAYPLTISTPYTINNPDVCAGNSTINLLVLVHTALDHFVRRRKIRETWANIHLWKNLTIRTVFFLGQTSDEKLQILIENESTVYNDIVQGLFTDTYRNLTHKGVMAYRWTTEFCLKARSILKVDDDMFVDVFKLMNEYVPRFTRKPKQIGCHLRRKGTSPIERKGSKWNVDADQFKNMSHYPMDYCNGYIVLMTPDLIKPMYQASSWTPFFWVDDVYLYGMLPMKVGNVNFVDIRSNLTILSRPGAKCFSNFTKPCKLLASGTGLPGTLDTMWKSTLLRLPSNYKTLIRYGIL